MVALYMAGGQSLPDICQRAGLPLDKWKRISYTALFKAEVKCIRDEIEEEFIDRAADDDLMMRELKMGQLAAIKRLRKEVDTWTKIRAQAV